MRSMIALLLALWLAPAWAQVPMTGAGLGKPTASGWTPASLPNLKVWYEAGQQVYTDSGCTSAASNGNTVLCMKDLSGNGKDLTIASGGPTLSVSGGKSTVNFNGSSTCLNNSSDALGIYANGSGSMFMAINSSPATNKCMLSQGNTGSSSPFACWIRSDTTTASTAYMRVRNDSTTDLLQNNLEANAFNGTNRRHGWTWDGTTVTSYLDGTSGQTRSLASGSSVTLTNLTMGCIIQNAGQGFWMAGNVAAFVAVTGVMSGSDIASLETYLSGLQ